MAYADDFDAAVAYVRPLLPWSDLVLKDKQREAVNIYI